MKFRKLKRWKYQLTESYHTAVPIVGFRLSTEFISLDMYGNLILAQYYAWDGASGPCPDVKSIMIASLVHDALYQLMRLGILNRQNRRLADRILMITCIENGMPIVFAVLVYWGVRAFAGKGVRPLQEEPVHEVPWKN